MTIGVWAKPTFIWEICGMSKNKIIKMLLFNAGLCLANILLFSKAFLHIDILGGSAIAAATGVMAIVMSVALFGYVNYRLLVPPTKPPHLPLAQARLVSLDGCSEALAEYIKSNVDTFAAALKTVIGQISRMKKKRQTIKNILLERFSDTEMSYGKFEAAISEVEHIMLLNVKSLLNRVWAFDEEEYENALRGKDSNSRLTETRRAILNDYTSFVSRSVDDNEEILLRLDKLILEISKLNDLHGGAIDELPAMREIDALIGDTKWYK